MPACEHAENTNWPRPFTCTATKRSSMMSGSGSHVQPVGGRAARGRAAPSRSAVTRGISPLT